MSRRNSNFVTKAESAIKKRKRKIRDHYNSLAGEGESEFRRRYLKE